MVGSPAIELTVLMPCLNEAKTLPATIRKARTCMARLGIAGEVLVADNGSTDGSPDIARAEGARVVEVAERGYGAALLHGTRAAAGRYVIMGDADDSYDFANLDAFVARLREGHDLVMGNRFLGGIDKGAMPWMNRHFGNPVLSAIGRRLFRCPVGDLNCGLRGYSREAFERMRLQTTGMEFASEMVIKATLFDMRIAEVPTTLRKDGRSRPPHMRPWRDGWRNLRFMLLYSPRWLFLYPGLVLMALGLLLGGLLVPGVIMLTPRVGLDVHSLVFASAFVLLGFQSVSFAVCARMYALSEGLLPPDPGFQRLLGRFKLEACLLAGAALFLGGLAGAIHSLLVWSGTGFGSLETRSMLRPVILSATAMCLGGQVILTSFLLGCLRLRRS